MNTIDLEKFRAAEPLRQPFEYVIVENFVRPEAFDAVNADYPAIAKAGNFPLQDLTYGPAFASFVQDLKSPAFAALVEEKFGIAVAGLDHLFSVRAHSHATDGNIHTDAPAKVLTALVYLNPTWEAGGGRLRLLRNGRDMEDYIAEVPPAAGTLLMFKRADNSWHGHKRHVGPRRTVQINWVTDKTAASKQYRPMTPLRRLKKLIGLEA